MGKIQQGEFEIFTTKTDAISKFREMRGRCREELSNGRPIEFHCSKKGAIFITNPPHRHLHQENATRLFGEVTEREGKTYVTYYTEYGYSFKVMKIIYVLILIAFCILGILLLGSSENKMFTAVAFIICIIYCISDLYRIGDEQRDSPKDSEIMVKELEKRVEAINKWDK